VSAGDAPALEVLEPGPAEATQRRVAGALRARGLGPGDRVAFCLPSSAALLVSVLGAARSAVVPVLLNATLLPEERHALVADSEPALVITEASQLHALLDGTPADLAPWPLVRPMHYTSGTTGRPRGVWSGLFEEAEAQALFDDEADLWGFDASDTHLVCSPMSHSVSVRFAAGTLLRGGRLLVLGRFDAGVAVDALVRHAPTTTFVAPTVLQRLLAYADAPARFSSLRLLVHAGAPCPPALKRSAFERVGPGVVWEFYGSTEGQFTACSSQEWLQRPGTVGRARPGRRLEVDPDGTVWCHAPGFARFSYWHDAAATAQAWRGDAFTVRDIGRLDDDGYLFLDGRRDDLVISGGVNIYPAEVESVLAELDAVADVAVFGVADEEWGQRLCAAVAGPVDEAALRRHAERHLAPYKRPKAYFAVAELPRTATGKVRRLDLPGLLGLPAPRPASEPPAGDGG